MFSAVVYGARWGVPGQNGWGRSNWMKCIILKFQWQNNSRTKWWFAILSATLHIKLNLKWHPINWIYNLLQINKLKKDWDGRTSRYHTIIIELLIWLEIALFSKNVLMYKQKSCFDVSFLCITVCHYVCHLYMSLCASLLLCVCVIFIIQFSYVCFYWNLHMKIEL